MSGLLRRIIRGGRGMPPAPAGAVLRVLRQAVRSDISLIRWTDDGTPETLSTTLLAVERTGLVVTRPEGTNRIRPGEPLELVLQGGGGRFRGRVRCLGLSEQPSGGNRPIPTIRLSLPNRLQGGERRQSHRVSVGFDLAPTGQLRDPEIGTTWLADIIDISMEGMQLRSRDDFPAIQPGDILWLETELPSPVGLLDRPVRIMNVRKDGRSDRYMLGVVLIEPVEELAEFIRKAEIRRAARLRSS